MTDTPPPQLTHARFFLKAPLDLTPDKTYAICNYVRSFDTKSEMNRVDYSMGLRLGYDFRTV